MNPTMLQAWVDKQEIAEALHKYPIALDRLDRDLLMSIGHPDARMDFDGLFRGDWPSFVDWVIAGHKDLLFSNHRLSNMLIDLDGDTARSESNVTVTALAPTPTGDVDERRIQSRYFDKWARHQGRWLLTERRLSRELRRMTRLSAADFKERFMIQRPHA